MLTTRKFSVLGDSNIKRHLNPTNCRDRPLMSGCQQLPCGRISLLAESLRSVREDSNVVLLSCLTNFLTSAEEAGSSVSFRVDPVFREVHEAVCATAIEKTEIFYLVAPPMYRLTPLWYRDGLPEVMTKFSEIFRDRPKNVLLMSSFATPEFESDGVHLTAYSGLEFVLHLFDAATHLLNSLSLDPTEAATVAIEASRTLEDRMMAIEQDHRRLNRTVEKKTASDAEAADHQENVRNEVWFVIRGLARQPEGLDPKEWQVRALRDVRGVLTVLLGEERPIVVVVNKTSRRKDAETRYHVLMASLKDSCEIRDKFGSFFVGLGDKRPDALKHISIGNLVTPATSVRIAIMKVLGQRYLASNPGSRVQVIKYEPRPVLKLTPPASVSDRRVQSYNYIEAIKSLPTNFSKEELSDIRKQIPEKLFGQLRAIFDVISDDVIKKRSFKVATVQSESKSGETSSSSKPSEPNPKSGEPNSKSGKVTQKRPNSSPDSGGSGKHRK